MPPDDRGRDLDLGAGQKALEPGRRLGVGGPFEQGAEDLAEGGRERHVPGHGDHVWLGATRKIGSGHRDRRGQGGAASWSGSTGLSRWKGTSDLAMAVGAPSVGIPHAAVQDTDRGQGGKPARRRPRARLTPVPQSRRHAATSGSSTTNRAPPPGASSIHDRTAVEPDVLGHQGEPEAGALARRPLAGPAAPVEALEEVGPLGFGDPRARGPRR